jgi:hypothetical protein
MPFDDLSRPRVRPSVDARRFPQTPEGYVSIYDRTLLSRTVLNVTPPTVWLIGWMDGTRTLIDICREFERASGQSLVVETLAGLATRLDQCLFLESPAFEAHYGALREHYRSLPARPALDMGPSWQDGRLTGLLEEILAEAPRVEGSGRVVGLIAPHLDYARGRPCYAAAYARLAGRTPPDRIVVLGTNHSPRTPVPTATGRDYETPLGRTRTDVDFIERLEARSGDLRRCELDHAREHSIELEVVWCQHLFGADRFTLVPILCTDPTVTHPGAEDCVDAGDVGRALRDLLASDGKDTLVIAGADLSHVGHAFGDDHRLESDFLDEVRRRDRAVLDHVAANDAGAFVGAFAGDNNPTRICSVGCIDMLMTALPGACAEVIGYHQAVDQETQTGVTCAAAVFTT